MSYPERGASYKNTPKWVGAMKRAEGGDVTNRASGGPAGDFYSAGDYGPKTDDNSNAGHDYYGKYMPPSAGAAAPSSDGVLSGRSNDSDVEETQHRESTGQQPSYEDESSGYGPAKATSTILAPSDKEAIVFGQKTPSRSTRALSARRRTAPVASESYPTSRDEDLSNAYLSHKLGGKVD